MAENAHQVPPQYGTATQIFHPRMRSYHRRLLAVAPSILLTLVCLWYMAMRRPHPALMAILAIVALGSMLVIYSSLRPQIVVLTQTHLLRGRLIGWKVVPLADIDHTIFAERLLPKQASGRDLKGMAALRYRGVPALWALDKNKKGIFRLDGRIWDAKTMRAIASHLSPQTTAYSSIDVLQMNKQWPGLVTFNELHPGWRSALLGTLSLIFLCLLGLLTLLPAETLASWGINL